MREHILIVDDDAAIRFGLSEYLGFAGFRLSEADGYASAIERLQSDPPDLMIADYKLPDGTALDLLQFRNANLVESPVLVLTAHGTIDLAVQAVKAGAEQFLTKPVALDSLLVLIERTLARQREHRQFVVERSRRVRGEPDPFAGSAPRVRVLAEQARRAAASDAPVLLLGETGTGKGVIARWIRANSARADEAYIDLNCAGLHRELIESELFGHERGAFTGAAGPKPGLIEAAHRGTLFLDEIGDMDPAVQPKLLKALEEKQVRRLGELKDRRVDVRIISATHQQLPALIAEKKFRSDLFYRINTITLDVPPLRARREDIPQLASTLLASLGAEIGIGSAALTQDAIDLLCDYDWPGNVRELRNILERALVLSGGRTIRAVDLHLQPAAAGSRSTGSDSLDALQLERIRTVLAEESGHVRRAAARLGISRSSLYERIKRDAIRPSRN